MDKSNLQDIAKADNNDLVSRLADMVSIQWQNEEKMRYIRAELNRRMGLLQGNVIHLSRKPKGKNNKVFWEYSIRPFLVVSGNDEHRALETAKFEISNIENNLVEFHKVGWSEKIAIEHGGKPRIYYDKSKSKSDK